MPLRLIDPNHTKIIEIAGTKIHIRSMTAGQQMRLGLLWRPEKVMASDDKDKLATAFTEKMVANYEQVAEAIAPAIVKIEGFESQPILEVLLNMADISDFMQLMTEIMEFSSLSESESKNLSSSLDTSAAIPARKGKDGQAVSHASIKKDSNVSAKTN